MRIKQTKSIHLKFERVLFWVLWVLLVSALFVYIYFIAMTVVQIVLRKELSVSMQEEESRISKLEAEYFQASSKLSRDIAPEYGLVDVAPSAYVAVSSHRDRITRNDI